MNYEGRLSKNERDGIVQVVNQVSAKDNTPIATKANKISALLGNLKLVLAVV